MRNDKRRLPGRRSSSRSLSSLCDLDSTAITVDHIPFPEIAAELGISEREVLRWARARARGKTSRASADYRAYALEVERRHRLIDYSLFFSDDLYQDGIFKNAKGAVA